MTSTAMSDLGPNWRSLLVDRIDSDGPVAIIGDVHGRSDLLARMYEQLGDIPLIFVGDLVDRGHDARGVLDLLIAHGARGVRGNHEEWFTCWATGEGFDAMALHPAMGGAATLRSYGVDPAWSAQDIASAYTVVPESHRRFISNLPLAIDLRVAGQQWWVLHAGVPHAQHLNDIYEGHEGSLPPPTAPGTFIPWLAQHRRLTLLWMKTWPEEMPPVDRPVVFGHVPDADIRDVGHAICVDTGCGTFPEGALSALILPQRRILTVR